MKVWKRNPDREFEKNRELWPDADHHIARLANESTPLNKRFEDGIPAEPEYVLRYICALERRVAAIERRERR